jgi:DNA polymerase zeta
MRNYGIPDKIYRDPYYSNETDVPERPKEFAGLVYNLKGGGLKYLEQWHGGSTDKISRILRGKYHPSRIYGWEYASNPPGVREVKKWLRSDAGERQDVSSPSKERSQVSSILYHRMPADFCQIR